MGTYLFFQKMCCTCQYWKGERKIAPGQKVIVDDFSKGMCEKQKREFKPANVMVNQSCYVKWDKMK